MYNFNFRDYGIFSIWHIAYLSQWGIHYQDLNGADSNANVGFNINFDGYPFAIFASADANSSLTGSCFVETVSWGGESIGMGAWYQMSRLGYEEPYNTKSENLYFSWCAIGH